MMKTKKIAPPKKGMTGKMMMDQCDKAGMKSGKMK
jgi:hypothetical protein